jgi:hypothetical protein
MASATATQSAVPAAATAAVPTATLNLANVVYETKGAIAYVTVNRPKVLNALNLPDARPILSALAISVGLMPPGFNSAARSPSGWRHALGPCGRYPAGRRCSGRGDQYSATRISQNALRVLVSRRSRARDARSTGRKP